MEMEKPRKKRPIWLAHKLGPCIEKKKVSEKRKLNKIKIQMAQKLPRKWAEIGARKLSP